MSANSAEPGRLLDVALVKGGRTKIRYEAVLLSDDGTRVTVRAPWAGDVARDFGFVRFEQGDVFTEHYWRDRWYSVKEVRDAAGVLKGWYCDITRPAVLTGTELVVEDLDLDLWRSADGRDVRRLDEDEFAASGLAERDPGAAARAVAALDELERLAVEGGFDALLTP
ncbi:ribonuclease FAU-1 family protein [Streptomyces sp. YIM S03343]